MQTVCVWGSACISVLNYLLGVYVYIRIWLLCFSNCPWFWQAAGSRLYAAPVTPGREICLTVQLYVLVRDRNGHLCEILMAGDSPVSSGCRHYLVWMRHCPPVPRTAAASLELLPGAHSDFIHHPLNEAPHSQPALHPESGFTGGAETVTAALTMAIFALNLWIEDWPQAALYVFSASRYCRLLETHLCLVRKKPKKTGLDDTTMTGLVDLHDTSHRWVHASYCNFMLSDIRYFGSFISLLIVFK